MVYIILGKGFEPVEAIAPCDILRRGGVDVKLAGIGGKTVEAAHGVTVAADCTVEEIDQNALEMLVLELICRHPTYGYELLSMLRDGSDGLFTLKEGTLYPILYRLEDEALIASRWEQGAGRTTPKKMYEATDAGRSECARRRAVWSDFTQTIGKFNAGGASDERQKRG